MFPNDPATVFVIRQISVVFSNDQVTVWPYANYSCDRYRFDQLLQKWTTAGELFCRLGRPLENGMSETTRVCVVGCITAAGEHIGLTYANCNKYAGQI